MASKWSARVSTVSLVLAAGLLASCGDHHPKPSGEVGTISVELVAHTPGATYHLRMASFAIAGPTTTTVTTGADPAAIAADAVAKMTLAFNTAKSTIEALPTVAHKDATTRKVEIQRSGTKADKPATKDSERD